MSNIANSPYSPVFSERFFYRWGIIFMGLSIVWPPYGYFHFGPLRATGYGMFAYLTWGVLGFLLAASPRLRLRLAQGIKSTGWLVAAFSLWLAWRMISSLLGEAPGTSVAAVVRDLVFTVPLFLTALILSRLREASETLVKIVVASTAVVLVVTLFEWRTQTTLVGFTGITFAEDPTLLIAVATPDFRSGHLRVQSTFAHALVYGQYLCWAAPIVWIALWIPISGAFRFIAILSLLVLPFAVFGTGTRSSLLAFAAMATLFTFLIVTKRMLISKGVRWLLLFCAAVLGVTVYATSDAILSGLIEGRDAAEMGSSRVRSVMLERGLEEIQASPVIGFGDARSAYHSGGFASGETRTVTIDKPICLHCSITAS